MAIRFLCPNCNEPLKVDDSLAGRKGRCPFCKAKMRIPGQSGTEATIVEKKPGQAKKDNPPSNDPHQTTVQTRSDGLNDASPPPPNQQKPVDNQTTRDDVPDSPPPHPMDTTPTYKENVGPVQDAVQPPASSHPMETAPTEVKPHSTDNAGDYVYVDDAPGSPPHPMDTTPTYKENVGPVQDAVQPPASSHPMETAPTEVKPHSMGNVGDYVYVDDAPGSPPHPMDTTPTYKENVGPVQDAVQPPASSHPMETAPTEIKPHSNDVPQPLSSSTEAQQPATPESVVESPVIAGSAVKKSLSAMESDAAKGSGASRSRSSTGALEKTLAERHARSAWGSLLLMTVLVLIFLGGFLGILWHAVKEKRITRNESQAAIRIRMLYSAQEFYGALWKRDHATVRFADDLQTLQQDGYLQSALWCSDCDVRRIDGYRFLLHPLRTEDGPGFFICAVPEKYGADGRKSYVINEKGRLLQGDTSGSVPESYPDTLSDRDASGNIIHWFPVR